MSWRDPFRNAYNMVINKFGDRLYTGLQDTIRVHLQGIAQRIDEAQGEGFLRELKLRWGNHNKSMQMIRDILMVRCPGNVFSLAAYQAAQASSQRFSVKTDRTKSHAGRPDRRASLASQPQRTCKS